MSQSEKTPRARIGDLALPRRLRGSLLDQGLHLGPDIDAAIKQQAWYIYRRNEIEDPRCQPNRFCSSKKVQLSRPQAANYDSVIDSVEIFAPLSIEEREW